jgi:adenylate cyclase
MNKSELLLNAKETKGLKITYGFRILLLVASTTGHLFSNHSLGEVIRVGIVSGFFTLGSIYMLYLIRNGNNLKLAGYLGLSADVFVMCFMPYNWYLSVGFIENVPPSYLLKTSLPAIAMPLITISSLAFRPLYPIILTLAFNCIWIFFMYLVLNDPRTIITKDFVENMFSAAIIPSFYFMYLITITSVGGMLALLCHSYRKSIHDAVVLEVQNTQLERYFSPVVLSQIKEVESIFQAKKSKVVVLFSDIRNFTAMSESQSPEEVVKFLRDYHSRMVQVIYKYGGTIDKFIGDGIMVTFGTPVPQADDCLRAVSCALGMREALVQFNMDLEKTDKDSMIHQGIGIHIGDAISGNIGSENRLEYTVIGDTVNLASRIESKCKELGRDVLFSNSFYKELNLIQNKTDLPNIQEIGNISIRGKVEPVTLYSI